MNIETPASIPVIGSPVFAPYAAIAVPVTLVAVCSVIVVAVTESTSLATVSPVMKIYFPTSDQKRVVGLGETTVKDVVPAHVTVNGCMTVEGRFKSCKAVMGK